jgi:FkbM family methyltransferase
MIVHPDYTSAVNTKMLARVFESLARGPVGSGVERGLNLVGLRPAGQKLYNWVLSTIAVRNGEYTISVGNAEAIFEIRSPDEYLRLKSMFENDVLSSLLFDLNADDVLYDVGANMGLYSCLVGDIIGPNRVVAFEPHPGNAERLHNNVNLNDLEPTIFNKALSDEEGEVSLAVAVESHTTSPGHNLIEINESVEEYGSESAETISTDMVRGDNFIQTQNLPEPTVLKVDVEGAEYNVLSGLREVLSGSACRLVYCEVHRNHVETFGSSDKEVRELLESCGFELESLNDHGTKYHLKAKK